jgi:hypothetical protein
MSQWISTDDRLPKPNTYVLGYHNRGTWHDSDDQKHVNFVIVKYTPGLSAADREKMKEGLVPDPREGGYLRSKTHKTGDEGGNNRKPYAWNTFGPGSFFGQEITHWMPLPEPPEAV